MAEGHFTKGLEVYLGVDRRRIGGAMTDEVADSFEGQVSINESLDKGMAQRVRTRSRHLDAGVPEIVFGSKGHRGPRHWGAGRQCPEEESTAR